MESSKQAKKEARKEAAQRLAKICTRLEELNNKCKLLLLQLKTKTRDAINLIKQYFNAYDKDNSGASSGGADRDKLRFKCLRHFLTQWFTSFLAFKDESMVLFTGELCRPYHAVEHKEFVHIRGKQGSYYKGSGVSACSVDGWRYEFNQTLAEVGRSDALETCAERCDAVSDSLEVDITAMDECGGEMLKALHSLNPKPISVVADFRSKSNKHMAERFRVELAADSSAGAQKNRIISLSRSDVQNISRKDGLSTVLEDLPRADLPSVAPSAPPVLDAAASLRRKVIVTEEDLEQEAEETQRRQRETRALEQQRKLKENYFGMSVSLDDVKRLYGRTGILSTAADREAEASGSSDEEKDGERLSVAMDVENSRSIATSANSRDTNAATATATTTTTTTTTTGRRQQQAQGDGQTSRGGISIAHKEALRAIRKGKRCTVHTPHPGLPLPKVRDLKLYVQIPAAFHESGGETQLRGLGCVEVTIEITWGDGWNAEAASLDSPRFVPAAEVLDEAFRQLWGFTAKGQQDPWYLFPRALAIVSGASGSSSAGTSAEKENSGQTFSRGEMLQLPPDGKGHTVQVFCESDPQCCDALMSIAAAVKVAFSERAAGQAEAVAKGDGPEESEEAREASRFAAEQAELREAARRAEPIVPDSLLLARWLEAIKASPKTGAVQLNLSQLSSALYHQENTILLLLKQVDALRARPGVPTKLHVDLSGSDVCGTLLAEFMRCSTQLTARNCSLDAYELRACAAMLESTTFAFGDSEDFELTALGKRANSAAAPAGPIASLPQLHLPDAIPLESLTLDSNTLFSSFGDAADIPSGPEGTVSALQFPPLDTFFCALFLSARSLSTFDVSHCCCLKPRGQALALCTAVLRAARLRTEAGLPPLQRLVVRGLRSLVSQSHDTKYALDVDSGFIQPLQMAMPGCAVDVGGVSRTL